jgi:uncharacterized Fe-S cluster-containing radical SAM superfamily protein
MTIDTAAFSARMRAKSVDVEARRLLVTRFTGTGQEDDLSAPANCAGHGRIRHFRRATSEGWPDNPLPIDPAAAALGRARAEEMTAQVFQNAACNWRCWYCYVPFDLLSAKSELASWVDADTLVDWYLTVGERPPIIDLSGGQPDLVPEWTAWMARALRDRGLDGEVYLWVDDNLSNDYFWRYLDRADRQVVAQFRSYGRVGCFKGYDETSFAFNTAADPALFATQFDLMRRHVDDGTDCYGYVTFTSPVRSDPSEAMARFLDRLQEIDEHLPLRVVPLEIAMWGPVQSRMRGQHEIAMRHQRDAVDAWNAELEKRYSAGLRALPIDRVALHGR